MNEKRLWSLSYKNIVLEEKMVLKTFFIVNRFVFTMIYQLNGKQFRTIYCHFRGIFIALTPTKKKIRFMMGKFSHLLKEQKVKLRAKQNDYWQNFSFHLIEVKSAIEKFANQFTTFF